MDATFNYFIWQVTANEDFIKPDRQKLEQELFAFLGNMSRRNHRSVKDAISLLLGEQAPEPNMNRCATWPKYKAPSTADSRSLGKFLQPFIWPWDL